MITCPRCGTQNPAGSRFCSNCGNDLTKTAGDDLTKTAAAESKPDWVSASEVPPTSPEWRMSPAGPLPEPPRRRTWLWVVLGLIGVCILLCCAFFIWGATGGQGFICDQLPGLIDQAQTARDKEQMRQFYQEFCLNAGR